LAGHDITVPAAFTLAQMSQLAQVADVRMVLAASSAPEGDVIQFLAGAPELLAWYRNAPAAARALIDAAMDARRLGMGAVPAPGVTQVVSCSQAVLARLFAAEEQSVAGSVFETRRTSRSM
jgi:hypothetical protein